VLAFPQGFLPGDEVALGEPGGSMPWRFPRDSLRSAIGSLRDDRLHTVLVTNFGCGPDSFLQKHLAGTLGERTPLVLEFDEHRARPAW